MGCKDNASVALIHVMQELQDGQSQHQTHDEDELYKEANESHDNEANGCPDGNLVKLCSHVFA